MNSIEDKISRKIYIVIGIVLCLTAIVMFNIQKSMYMASANMPVSYTEGYGDETSYSSDEPVIEEDEHDICDIEVERITIEDYTDDTYWNVRLVNKKELVDANNKVVLGTLSNGKQVDKRIVDITNQMISDAQADGVSLIPCSAYRSYSYQTGLYNKEVNSWLAQGYSDEDARELASREVAIPGTSEHQLGLAIDFLTKGYSSLDQGFENTDAFKWLDENAYKYGWILRYQKGKEMYTGIIYEPWHWRYLGPELAEKVKDSGLCYEEFLGRDYTF